MFHHQYTLYTCSPHWVYATNVTLLGLQVGCASTLGPSNQVRCVVLPRCEVSCCARHAGSRSDIRHNIATTQKSQSADRRLLSTRGPTLRRELYTSSGSELLDPILSKKKVCWTSITLQAGITPES